LAGFTGPADPDYLRAGMAGGEGYDWYYASDADRIAQNRTPIQDTAHGEDWVFRQKDLRNWYQNRHFERPNGIRNNAPTSWRPAAKPVRLMEIGFPAIDRGTNAPNRFYDPKSVESLLPHFSSGERDDLQQKYALEAALSYWQEQSFVDAAYVWCWDARPWPDFPQRTDVWSDGDNWRYGHWLNGRSGLITLKDVITDLAGLISVEIDGDGLYGLIDGYAVTKAVREGRCGLEKRSLPIIAVTAHAMAEDRIKTKEGGMNGHLVKPFDLEKLALAMADVFADDQG